MAVLLGVRDADGWCYDTTTLSGWKQDENLDELLCRLKWWTLRQARFFLWARWERSWSEATAWCWGTGATEPGLKSAWRRPAGTKLGEWQHFQPACRSNSNSIEKYSVSDICDVSCRDIGSMDAYSYIRIKGRIKDMIIRGGENVYPAEIEQFLHTHPKVKEAQVSSHTRNTSQVMWLGKYLM